MRSTSAAYESANPPGDPLRAPFDTAGQAPSFAWGARRTHSSASPHAIGCKRCSSMGTVSARSCAPGMAPAQARQSAAEQVERIAAKISLKPSSSIVSPAELSDRFARAAGDALAHLFATEDREGTSPAGVSARAAEAEIHHAGVRGHNYSNTVRQVASLIGRTGAIEHDPQALRRKTKCKPPIPTTWRISVPGFNRLPAPREAVPGKVLLDAVGAAEPTARAMGARASRVLEEFRTLPPLLQQIRIKQWCKKPSKSSVRSTATCPRGRRRRPIAIPDARQRCFKLSGRTPMAG